MHGRDAVKDRLFRAASGRTVFERVNRKQMEGFPRTSQHFFSRWHFRGERAFHSSWDKKCFCGVRFVNCNEQFGFVYIHVYLYFSLNKFLYIRAYICIYISYIYRRQSITSDKIKI